VWDHADMMHNILNSLRGEAVPEQGVMHGSAIQVSRRITSARRHVYGSTIRVLSTLVRSRQDGVIALGVGRIYPLPRSPITGTARRPTKKTHWNTVATAGWGACIAHFLSESISLALLRRTDGVMVAKAI
jgi:hypothetical protein